MNRYPSYLAHYGVGADEDPPGRGSGRYPKGSGDHPYQHDEKKRKDYEERLNALEKSRARMSARAEEAYGKVTQNQEKMNARVNELRARYQRRGMVLDERKLGRDREYRKLLKKDEEYGRDKDISERSIAKLSEIYDEMNTLVNEIKDSGYDVSSEKVDRTKNAVTDLLNTDYDFDKYKVSFRKEEPRSAVKEEAPVVKKEKPKKRAFESMSTEQLLRESDKNTKALSDLQPRYSELKTMVTTMQYYNPDSVPITAKEVRRMEKRINGLLEKQAKINSQIEDRKKQR